MDTNQLENTKAIFARERRINAAYLLGSSARGTLRSDSDVDIGVLLFPDQVLNFQERLDLRVRLEKILQRDVDLGIMDRNNLIYAKEAFLTGRCIYCLDVFQRDLYVATTLGMYIELRELRAEVEHAYLAG